MSREKIEEYLVYGGSHCMTVEVRKLEAEYAELEKKYENDPATIQLLDCTDRCLELEESAELRLHIGQEYKERMIKAEEQRDELQKQRDKLYESNNRQSDIIYDLKVERDELIEFLNCIITRYDNDDSVSGIYLDKARNYLLQIKGEEL